MAGRFRSRRSFRSPPASPAIVKRGRRRKRGRFFGTSRAIAINPRNDLVRAEPAKARERGRGERGRCAMAMHPRWTVDISHTYATHLHSAAEVGGGKGEGGRASPFSRSCQPAELCTRKSRDSLIARAQRPLRSGIPNRHHRLGHYPLCAMIPPPLPSPVTIMIWGGVRG